MLRVWWINCKGLNHQDDDSLCQTHGGFKARDLEQENAPQQLRTQFLFCCDFVCRSFYPYPSGLPHWHWGNHMIAPVPVKQPWRIWVNSSPNSLWPRDVIWWQGSRSTLAQVMACCLMAPSHYLNQRWLMISEMLWHSPDSNFTEKYLRYLSLKWVLNLLIFRL